jgi:hypothetical protein
LHHHNEGRAGGDRFTQFGAQAGQFGLHGLVFLGIAGQVGAGAGQAVDG